MLLSLKAGFGSWSNWAVGVKAQNYPNIYENFWPGLWKRSHLSNGNATSIEATASQQEHRLI